MIRVLGAQLGGGAVAQSASLVAPLRGPLQLIGPPQPQGALGIHCQALAGGDLVSLALAPAGMTPREPAQPLPVSNVGIRALGPGPTLGRAGLAHNTTRTTLRHPEPIHQPFHSDPATIRGHHFPSERSFSIALSSSASASSLRAVRSRRAAPYQAQILARIQPPLAFTQLSDRLLRRMTPSLHVGHPPILRESGPQHLDPNQGPLSLALQQSGRSASHRHQGPWVPS